MTESIRTQRAIGTKAWVTAGAVVSAVLLPQIFHLAGIWSGTGALAGSSFLPMHIPVLLAGLLGGPMAGLLAGLVSPVLSFGLTGMPTAAMLPMMMAELAGYGLASGWLRQARMPVFAKLLIAQIAGRGVRALFILAAVIWFHPSGIALSGIWTAVIAGLPGILLQWALIPLLVYRLNRLSFFRS